MIVAEDTETKRNRLMGRAKRVVKVAEVGGDGRGPAVVEIRVMPMVRSASRFTSGFPLGLGWKRKC